MADVTWFRSPTDVDDRGECDPGTLNACYNALDIHVIRGHADDLALVVGGVGHTFARLLTDVGAFAGVLRAFGTESGHEVVAVGLSGADDVLVQLAAARVGAVLVDEASATTPTVAVHHTAPATPPTDDRVVITIDTSSAHDKATLMRAGATDPAGCADVPGDQPLRIVAGEPVLLGAHLVSVLDGTASDPVFGPLAAGHPVVVPG